MTRPPSTGEVTSPYGPRRLQVPGVGPFHYGEDTVGEGNYAPEAGVIVYAGYSGVFGNIILIRSGDVVWNIAHHAHLNGRQAGQRVAEGEFLAPQGATGLATGRHAHTERRRGGRDAIQSGSHSNPRDHYTSTAASKPATPFVPPPPPRRRQKEDTMLVLAINTGSGKHHALLGPGVFSHVMPADLVDVLADVNDAKRVFDIDLPYLARLLRLWGCDRDIWDIRDGKFVVLDPLGGTVGQGNTWTAERAVRGAIAGIRLPAIDTKPLVDAVAKALADGRDYDAAEIAKAVNDDAARRLLS